MHFSALYWTFSHLTNFPFHCTFTWSHLMLSWVFSLLFISEIHPNWTTLSYYWTFFLLNNFFYHRVNRSTFYSFDTFRLIYSIMTDEINPITTVSISKTSFCFYSNKWTFSSRPLDSMTISSVTYSKTVVAPTGKCCHLTTSDRKDLITFRWLWFWQKVSFGKDFPRRSIENKTTSNWSWVLIRHETISHRYKRIVQFFEQ